MLHTLIFWGASKDWGCKSTTHPKFDSEFTPEKVTKTQKEAGSSDPSNHHFSGVFAVKLLGSNGPRFWTYILEYRIFPSSGDDPIIQSLFWNLDVVPVGGEGCCFFMLTDVVMLRYKSVSFESASSSPNTPKTTQEDLICWRCYQSREIVQICRVLSEESD